MLRLFLILNLIWLFTACDFHNAGIEEPLFPCAPSSQYARYLPEQQGTVKRVELWLPERADATPEEVQNGSVAMLREEFWFIIADDDRIEPLLPCNLPVEFQEHNLWIIFSGHALKAESNPTMLLGIEAFSIEFIEEDVSDDDDDW
ncbi:MAG: hypothetical protein JJT94_10415 [Bernardetiaceae bacterium]|nr:hypothetical protein [Bernardetiaceae bacterium]